MKQFIDEVEDSIERHCPENILDAMQMAVFLLYKSSTLLKAIEMEENENFPEEMYDDMIRAMVDSGKEVIGIYRRRN